MSAIDSWFMNVWGDRLGWMLVHSVWEIGAIAFVYAIVLLCIPRSAASARYWAGCVALLLMMVALPATYTLLETSAPRRTILIESADVLAKQATLPSATTGRKSLNAGSKAESERLPVPVESPVSWSAFLAPFLPWLTISWFAGVTLFSLRLMVGLAGVERLRRSGLGDVGVHVDTLGRALAERLQIRQVVKFAASTLVQVPTVIGYLRPVVLLPAVSFTGLSTRQVEFLLAHELAHIKRHDYLHNIVQGVVETLLFYHPAMWWVSSCVRQERENCCDDLVVSTLENKADYARTLFALEQCRTGWSPSLAASDGRLLHRIRRLIGAPARAGMERQWGKGLAGFVALLLVTAPLAVAALSFASQRSAFADESKVKANADGPKNESGKNEQPTFVRLVVGPNKKATFEGEEIKWDDIEAVLQKVSNRKSKVLEVAISTDDVSVRDMNNAVGTASHYGRELGFKYTSYIGVHPLGSKGTQTNVAPAAPIKNDQPANEKKDTTSDPQSQRLKFVPRHGKAKDTNWTALVPWNVANEKQYERLMAHVTLEGEFPVQRVGEKKPIFKVKLLAGSDDSLNVNLTTPNGTPYFRVLHRGKPLSWKLDGKRYELLYPDSFVALDKSSETPFAMIVITCKLEAANERKTTESKGEENRTDNEAPDESSDDSKRDGGSDMLRNIRASSAPIEAELAEKHGYRLKKDQVIGRVAPPFPELRMTYYRVGNPSQWQAIPKGASSMLFLWSNNRLQNWGMSFGPEPDGDSLRNVIRWVLSIKNQEMEGPKELLDTTIRGDWVIRKGANAELKANQLQKILREELAMPVKVGFQNLDREVYVARGDYKLMPLPGHKGQGKMSYTDSSETTDEVEIFAEELVPNSGSGGGTGKFPEFLQWLGDWIGSPVVDETGKRPQRSISWSLNGHSPATAAQIKNDHDAELVLPNITKQTGLKFTKEKRPVRVLVVKEEK